MRIGVQNFHLQVGNLLKNINSTYKVDSASYYSLKHLAFALYRIMNGERERHHRIPDRIE